MIGIRHTRWIVLLALFSIVALGPSTVMADELWIQNEGALQVLVDGDVTDVQLSGAVNIADGIDDEEEYTAMYGYNPDYGEGQTMVVAASISTGWVVITGDITSWDIQEACDQHAEEITPVIRQVIDYEGTRISFDPTTQTRTEVLAALSLVGPLPPSPLDGSTTLDEAGTIHPIDDDSNGPSIAEMNAEKAIKEYNEWFVTVSWNELD